MRMNLSGQRFGRLVVVSEAEPRGYMRRWLCKCDCGREKTVYQTRLRNKGSQSCGCLSRELILTRCITHGGSRTIEYNAWCAMISRCENPKNRYYCDYGGRGIKVCKQWRNSFPSFVRDMGLRPDRKMMLERRNNNGNYTPRNCYWATRSQQNRNRRKFGSGWRANSHGQ